jgi:hypothetical protein
MIRMKHLSYTHARNKSLVETLTGGIARMLVARLQRSPAEPGGHQLGRRVLVSVCWLLALAIQAGLLVLVAELVEVIHGVMELYLDLAGMQLDLQSTYVAATTPK